jgi:DNA-binding Lrp family transcriptional regulator
MTVPLDDHERALLKELERNCRQPNQKLAEIIGLSPAACWRRLKRLEEEGVIRQYAALLDPRKVGVGEVVFAHVSMDHHNKSSTEAFCAGLLQRSEISECYATTGDADYLLRVTVPDVRAYHRFLEEFIFVQPHLKQVRSNFALKELKFDMSLPF